MGTLGRDVSFWLFALFSAAAMLLPAAAGRPAALGAALSAAALFWHFLWELPAARKRSREAGLETAALIPLSRPAARLWLFFLGWRPPGRWEQAYEIHAPGYTGTEAAGQFGADLLLVERAFPRPALYVWETPLPVPSAVRSLVRSWAKGGAAVWLKGPLPVPKAPACGFKKGTARHAHRGAVLLSPAGDKTAKE